MKVKYIKAHSNREKNRDAKLFDCFEGESLGLNLERQNRNTERSSPPSHQRPVFLPRSNFLLLLFVVESGELHRTLQVRLFHNAPHGTLVYVVDANTFNLPFRHDVITASLSGAHAHKFELTSHNDVIVAEVPYFSGSIGEGYDVTVAVTTTKLTRANYGQSEARQTVSVDLRVIVSEPNHFPPQIHASSNLFETHRHCDVTDVIGRVSASDADAQTYNRVTRFSIASRVSAVQVDAASGELSVARDLSRDVISVYRFRVTAINTGSPARESTRLFRLFARNISGNSPITILTPRFRFRLHFHKCNAQY